MRSLATPQNCPHRGQKWPARRRLRWRAFILLFVATSFISRVSAESSENLLIPLCLLFPPKPFRYASVGALLPSDNHPICPKYAESHPLYSRENSSRKPLKVVATIAQGYLYPTPIGRSAHSGPHAQTGVCFRWGWYPYSQRALRGPESLRAQRSGGILCHFCMGREAVEKNREPLEQRRASCASLFRGVAAPQGRAAPLLALTLHR